MAAINQFLQRGARASRKDDPVETVVRLRVVAQLNREHEPRFGQVEPPKDRKVGVSRTCPEIAANIRERHPGLPRNDRRIVHRLRCKIQIDLVAIVVCHADTECVDLLPLRVAATAAQSTRMDIAAANLFNHGVVEPPQQHVVLIPACRARENEKDRCCESFEHQFKEIFS